MIINGIDYIRNRQTKREGKVLIRSSSKARVQWDDNSVSYIDISEIEDYDPFVNYQPEYKASQERFNAILETLNEDDRKFMIDWYNNANVGPWA